MVRKNSFFAICQTKISTIDKSYHHINSMPIEEIIHLAANSMPLEY